MAEQNHHFAMYDFAPGNSDLLRTSEFALRERTNWRDTLRGAWQSYSKGLRGQLAEAKEHKDRIKLKRPGEK